ncbi:hypothetical protein HPB50_018384 [Hyalomma asiaticum]|uniref:Uncharacterized protein n=1 Tax=Hyalomma asiaticum TaxID=266040 RepID=A0ACB7TAK0_HYAAI|nr:hypothetical protein HPB50_018384 [Hyalomma asiaticum]
MQVETNSARIPKHVQENVTVAPIPRNTHPAHNEGRRRARAKALLKQLGKGGTSASFVDAAAYRGGKKFTAVVVDQSGSTMNCATLRTTNPQVAEQVAIALALLNSRCDEVYSDSKAAGKTTLRHQRYGRDVTSVGIRLSATGAEVVQRKLRQTSPEVQFYILLDECDQN